MVASIDVARLQGFPSAKRGFVNDTRIIKIYAMVIAVKFLSCLQVECGAIEEL